MTENNKTHQCFWAEKPQILTNGLKTKIKLRLQTNKSNYFKMILDQMPFIKLVNKVNIKILLKVSHNSMKYLKIKLENNQNLLPCLIIKFKILNDQ